jgi:hypothetical protein
MTREMNLAVSLMPREELIPGAFALRDVARHNQSLISGSGPIDIMTPPDQWAYAVTFPYRRTASAGTYGEVLLVRVETEVHAGRIGVGCVSSDLQTYLDTEVDCTPENGSVVLKLPLRHLDSTDGGWLVMRNTAEGNRPSRVTVRSIRTFRTAATHVPDLVESEPRPIRMIGPTRSLTRHEKARGFRVALTHTSRNWDWSRCTRRDMVERYSDPNRLRNLPPFDELPPPPTHLYSGGLSLLDLAIDRDGINLLAVRSVESTFKIQHATVVGTRLVLCFENFLAVLPANNAPLNSLDVSPGSPCRIDDNWFSGLHTVFPVNDDICLVSSSGADAVLWVDLRSRKVIKRWRLPAGIYGVNYELTPAMSVSRHYIYNEIQLGHLNCAYPDGKGGCYISTLAQGDIGHVDEDGRYSLLARGYVGCHGVRVARNGRDIYFSDSCGGRLMRLEPDGSVHAWRTVNSRWLHDVEQVDSDLYVFCLGDRNEVALVDLSSGEEQGRFAFDKYGLNVQFVSVARTGEQ